MLNKKNSVSSKVKKVDKKSVEKQEKKIISRKLIIAMAMTFLLLFLLIVRLFWLEIVQGAEYKEVAYNQQTINRIISPKRGTIYDATGSKTLAISSRVDTVTLNPGKVKYSDDELADDEFVAKGLSEIFALDYNEVLEKVKSESTVITIAKKVDQDKITALKKWMNDNDITAGINIDEDSKRSYPYGSVASSVLGFCGTDNQGLWGLEYSLEDLLTGTAGRITTSANVVGQEIPDENRQYIAPQNGNDIVLSIDYNIQSIVEKYLKQAVIQNDCKNGGTAIVMNPETGDILAMANYPDYDLNTPYTPNESLANGWDKLTSDEKVNKLNEMWRNKAASATYEPGSTFKTITAAIALEEGLVDTETKNFYCSGSYTVTGQSIDCWRWYNPHGSLSLKEALEKSCNPAFMQLGQKIGVTRFYKYMRAFGLFESTHSGLYGEAGSIMHGEDTILPIELATLSFGQRFNITPLQLVTAVSAVVNDGVLMKPRIVKQIINADTGVVTNVDPVEVRQVISKETSEKMCELLRAVVVEGTGGNANIEGYSIGGKSGTTEPLDDSDDGYIASFIGVVPTTDVKAVVLVALYKPTGGTYQGGDTAAPVVNQIFSELLPYMGISSSNNAIQEEENNSEILLADVRNKTISEAQKVLRNAGFKVISNTNENKDSTLVADQVPKPGARLVEDSTIYLYAEDDSVHVSVSVPDLTGMNRDQAINSVRSKNLNIVFNGDGSTVIAQDYISGTQVEQGTIITVTMKEKLDDAH